MEDTNSVSKNGNALFLFLRFLILPLIIVFYEIILRVHGAEKPMENIDYPLIFGISAGLFFSAFISLLPKKAERICFTTVSAVCAVVFAAECLIKENFQTYMELDSVFAGTKGVMNDYGENLASSVLKSIPLLLLFAAPPVLCGIFAGKLLSERDMKHRLIHAAAAAVCSAALFGAGAMAVTSGEEKDKYDAEYYFDSAADTFGLVTGLRLSLINSVPEEPDGETGGFVPVSYDFDDGYFQYDTWDAAEVYDETYDVIFTEEELSDSELFSEISSIPNISEMEMTSSETSLFSETETENSSEEQSSSLSETETSVSSSVTETPSVTTTTAPPPTETTVNVPAETAAPVTVTSAVPVTEAPVTAPPVTETYRKPFKSDTIDPEFNIMDIDFDAITAAYPKSAAAELNEYVKTLPPSRKNSYTGLFKGKNLILICAEALSDVAIDKELTPTLYRMSRNGFYFSDYYQPSWGGSTSTGEFSFITGLVPRSGVKSMLGIKNNNNYFTLGNQLQREHYLSCAYHNGSYDYYSRNLTHKNLGYQSFLAFGNGLEKLIRKYSEDTPMFDKSLDYYLDKQPFSLYYMSVSGHCTYKSGNIKVKENLAAVNARYGNKYKDTTKYYLCYQMEFEKAMRTIVEKLEAAGIADNTVICITSDHYPYGLEISSAFGNSQDYVTDLYGYKYTTPWSKDHNSLIIWSGCLENELSEYACEISEPTYSLDIVPTLSNLFGLEYDSRLLVGRDVFSDAEPIVVWNNFSWRTVRGSYDAAKRTFYPNVGYEYDKVYVDRMNSIVRNKIYYSEKVVNCDYFCTLFGKDDIY